MLNIKNPCGNIKSGFPSCGRISSGIGVKPIITPDEGVNSAIPVPVAVSTLAVISGLGQALIRG